MAFTLPHLDVFIRMELLDKEASEDACKIIGFLLSLHAEQKFNETQLQDILPAHRQHSYAGGKRFPSSSP